MAANPSTVASPAGQIAGIVASVQELKRTLDALPSSTRLSDGETEAIYALAHQFVVQARHEVAFRYFSLLVLYRPANVKFLQGLALTHRMLERYDEAINVYSFLATIDPDNLRHSMDIVECLLLKQEVDDARRTVQSLVAACKQSGDDKALAERAQAMIDLLAQ